VSETSKGGRTIGARVTGERAWLKMGKHAICARISCVSLAVVILSLASISLRSQCEYVLVMPMCWVVAFPHLRCRKMRETDASNTMKHFIILERDQ
jgi:hypothetical protein